MLNNPISCHAEFSHLIDQCRLLIDWGGWEVKLSHCFRETNQVADKFAKLGLDMSVGVLIHRDPPVEARDALDVDNRGASWPRIIIHK